jgi:hypothetical protein
MDAFHLVLVFLGVVVVGYGIVLWRRAPKRPDEATPNPPTFGPGSDTNFLGDYSSGTGGAGSDTGAGSGGS